MKWRVIFIILFLISAAPVTRAQDNTQPLIIAGYAWEDGFMGVDLYQVDGLQQLTFDGLKRDFKLSPDGRSIAYLTAPPLVREAGQSVDRVVWDVGLLDLGTGESRSIAVQPTEAALDDTGNLEYAYTRKGLTWSPDSRQLAWVESENHPWVALRLVVYDITSQETRVLDDDLPALWQVDDGIPGLVAWGEGGIAVFTNNPQSDIVLGTLRLYDPQAGFLRTIDIGLATDFHDQGAFPLSGPVWVRDGEDEILLTQLVDGYWYRADPHSGEIEWFQGSVAMVSLTNPETSLRALWVPDEENNYTWQVMTPAGETVYSSASGDSIEDVPIALSPLGDQFVYSDRGLFLWSDGVSTPLDTGNITELYQQLWGATEWQAVPLGITWHGPMG